MWGQTVNQCLQLYPQFLTFNYNTSFDFIVEYSVPYDYNNFPTTLINKILYTFSTNNNQHINSTHSNKDLINLSYSYRFLYLCAKTNFPKHNIHLGFYNIKNNYSRFYSKLKSTNPTFRKANIATKISQHRNDIRKRLCQNNL